MKKEKKSDNCTWGNINYNPYTFTDLKGAMKDLTIEQEAIIQLVQEIYVLKNTVICGKTVEERVKESNKIEDKSDF